MQAEGNQTLARCLEIKHYRNMAVDLKRSIRTRPIVQQTVKQKVVVVAIDFGTTYSGYAYSFHDDFETDPLKIEVPRWDKGQSEIYEVPTCALFNPKQEFDSFGYEAEKKYNQLALDSENHNWYFFRHFKMVLYENRDLTRRLDLTDDKGLALPAITVFAKSIEYLKDKFLEDLSSKQHPVLKDDDIHWVLTVPAIWSDGAKQFMREAAIEGGIHTDRLSIALEPEAAALFCRYKSLKLVRGAAGSEIQTFGPGDKYLILDAGGGTIDITAHEIQGDGTVKELHRANGGDWGGKKIDENLDKLLNEVIGGDTIEIIHLRYKDDYLDIMNSFEIIKKGLKPDNKGKITINLPSSVAETYESLNDNQKLETGGHIPHHLRGRVSLDQDKVHIDADIVTGLYAETCEQIVNHIRQVLDESTLKDVNRILMVGGFSESTVLQDAIKRAFPGKVVIVPEEAGLAVLKGAVTFGHCPTLITSRVCKYTYGIRALRDFQPGLDGPERRITKKIGDKTYFLCDNTFSLHATRGECIDVGESRGKHEYVPSEPGEKKLTVSVFKSPRKYPVYTDEANCEFVGDIEVNLQDSVDGKDRPVTVEMIFGGPELTVELCVEENGETRTQKATFDCLGN